MERTQRHHTTRITLPALHRLKLRAELNINKQVQTLQQRAVVIMSLNPHRFVFRHLSQSDPMRLFSRQRNLLYTYDVQSVVNPLCAINCFNFSISVTSLLFSSLNNFTSPSSVSMGWQGTHNPRTMDVDSIPHFTHLICLYGSVLTKSLSKSPDFRIPPIENQMDLNQCKNSQHRRHQIHPKWKMHSSGRELASFALNDSGVCQ